MADKALTIEEQIKKLEERGLKINCIDKAKETLLDIGYYRLGFYWHYFQDSENDHKFTCDIALEDIINLYYFDSDLKNLLLKYIYRIEVHFRTQIVYIVSNHYKQNNKWYVDPTVINSRILKDFNSIYYNLRTKNAIISKHHTKYPEEAFAPAWKTF